MVIVTPLVPSSKSSAQASKGGTKETTKEKPESTHDTIEQDDDEIPEFPIAALGSLGRSPFDFQPFLADPFSAAMERMTLDPWTALQRSVRADPFCPSYSSALRSMDPFGEFGEGLGMFTRAMRNPNQGASLDLMNIPTNSPVEIKSAMENLMNRYSHAKNPFAPQLAGLDFKTRKELIDYLEDAAKVDEDEEEGQDDADENLSTWDWVNPNSSGEVCLCKCGKKIGTCSCAEQMIPIPAAAAAVTTAQNATTENTKPSQARGISRRRSHQSRRARERRRHARKTKSAGRTEDERSKSRGRSTHSHSKSRGAQRHHSRESRNRPKQQATKRRLPRK